MTPESTKRFLAWLEQEIASAKTKSDDYSMGHLGGLLSVKAYFFGPPDTAREDAMALCKNEVPTPEEYLDALAETLYKGMP